MNKTSRRVMTVIMAALTAVAFWPQGGNAGTGTEPGFSDVTDGALVVDGRIADGNARSGFHKDFTLMTKDDLDGIVSEATADRWFAAPGRDSFVSDKDYSARRRNDQWCRQRLTRGIDLRAMQQSLGIAGDPVILYKALDGYSNNSAGYGIWIDRYCFPDARAASGTRVDPALALSGNYLGDFDDHVAGDELPGPMMMMGQTSASSDYNAQYMGKLLKEVTFGNSFRDWPTALTLDNNGYQKELTIADVILGTRPGSVQDRKQALYTFTDDGEHSVRALGVTLGDLADDLQLSASGQDYIVKDSAGNTRTIDAGESGRYFLAYEGTIDDQPLTADGDLLLLCPGESRDQVIFNIRSIGAAPLKAPSGFSAARRSYNSLRLSWTAVSGASGYYIDRYNCSTKKWQNYAIDVMSGTAAGYNDKGLTTGTNYRYRIRAYKVIGDQELLGYTRLSGYAKPVLGAAVLGRLTKSGSRAVKVRWKRVAGASGYQVVRATSKNMKRGRRSVTVSRGKTVSLTMKKLQRGRRYYFRVRAFRKAGGRKVYGAYSRIKSIRR
jgi:hypothetical protein